VFPLLEIVPLAWEPPAARVDALLFTSARAPALVAARAPGLAELPVYAVGPRTAEAATAAGFAVVAQGATDGSAAAAIAAGQGIRALLHMGGEDRAPFRAPPVLHVAHVATYAARRISSLSAEVQSALLDGRVYATLLFSARTARHLTALAIEAGLDRALLRLVALSPAVAAAAGPGWRVVATAARPDLEAALAAAVALWQGDAHG
jgi:uroporphyrinogen-III synthase